VLEKKSKVGRPKLAKGLAKALVMQTRVQPDEIAAFRKEAKKQGLTLSEFVRQTLKNAVE
jgi:predicted HicB family RNase H-like nuclease